MSRTLTPFEKAAIEETREFRQEAVDAATRCVGNIIHGPRGPCDAFLEGALWAREHEKKKKLLPAKVPAPCNDHSKYLSKCKLCNPWAYIPEPCVCELRDRLWHPNKDRCERCGGTKK